MAENFYTILTQVGLAKLANALALGTQVDLTELAVGDGNGAYYNPVASQTALKNETWRGPISTVKADDQNQNWLVIEAVIPTSDGGFMIREVGVFDNDGDMIAIGKYPETYKPITDEGSAKDLYVRMIIEVSNASSVTLKIDPAIVLATKKDVDNLAGAGRTTQTVKKNADDIASVQQEVAAHLADYTKYGFGNRPYTVSYSTIYIDEANGNDANNGLTEQTAVKTRDRLIQLIPIFLQNANFTIKIIGNLSAVLVIPTVLLSHSSGPSRRLIVEGITQNKENHELVGIRAHSVQCILEIRHVNVTANAVHCFTCTYVEINNVSSSLDSSDAAIVADNGTNMYIRDSEINNLSGVCIMSARLSRILSRNNTGSGTYGLYANNGDIIKYDATQPTGTTSDEREFGGGVVR